MNTNNMTSTSREKSFHNSTQGFELTKGIKYRTLQKFNTFVLLLGELFGFRPEKV